jgi:hypothetical protein
MHMKVPFPERPAIKRKAEDFLAFAANEEDQRRKNAKRRLTYAGQSVAYAATKSSDDTETLEASCFLPELFHPHTGIPNITTAIENISSTPL